jgi:hypothetical protein
MTIQLNVEIPDVNTILEGLQRVGENAQRVASIVREQGTAQFEALQAAEQKRQAEANAAPQPPQAPEAQA